MAREQKIEKIVMPPALFGRIFRSDGYYIAQLPGYPETTTAFQMHGNRYEDIRSIIEEDEHQEWNFRVRKIGEEYTGKIDTSFLFFSGRRRFLRCEDIAEIYIPKDYFGCRELNAKLSGNSRSRWKVDVYGEEYLNYVSGVAEKVFYAMPSKLIDMSYLDINLQRNKPIRIDILKRTR